MKLKDLLHRIPIVSATADMDMDITGVSYDSRTTAEGDIFVAISGEAVDGHKFVPMAAEKGAVCAVVERPVEGIPYVVVENSRQALALMGANWFDHPACEMTMIGVTGTSGKTTSTYLLKAILEQAGHLDGTVAVGVGLDDGHHLDTGLVPDRVDVGGDGIQIDLYIGVVEVQIEINSKSSQF